MEDTLRIQKFIPCTKDEVYKYFTVPGYLERWCYPDGMTLKVPVFEARTNGAYRYEHTGTHGVYTCTGVVQELIPEEKLVTVDSVKDPQGKSLFENLKGEVLFQDAHGGTDLFITQSGFPDAASLADCQRGWDECLDNLSGLFDGRLVPKASQGHVDSEMYQKAKPS